MAPSIDENDLDCRERVCRAVIQEAGHFALDWFERRTSIAVSLKGPMDYASEADAAVERLVRGRLAEAFPDDAFLGEEEGGETGERVWVLDPVDGTANFVRGITRFCVSLAFVSGKRIELGAICSPATGELYLARRGRGATLNGAPIRCAATTAVERASIEIGWSSRLPYGPYLAAIERMLAAGIDFRRFGSGAMGLAWVADGRADAYLELHINSWDCLAGILLVEEAGGRVNDFLAGDGLRRGNPVLAAAPGVAERIAELAGVPLRT